MSAINLNQSYLSGQYVDRETSINYAFGKVNGSIVADVDGNGYVDIVTFPSGFNESTVFEPIIWANTNGVFTPTHPANPNEINYQYIRNTAEGDFDGDGRIDFLLADQGWELEGRNPDFFFGGIPMLLKGIDSGLEVVPIDTWTNGNVPANSFYHISSAADYDQDGDTDIAIASFWDFSIFENDGNGSFRWRHLDTQGNSTDAGSGTGFIKLGDEYALVVGFYRMMGINDRKSVPLIFTQEDGEFRQTMELSKPDLGGREQNFGAVDMYNVDINNDGKEDLLMLWETEALGGVDDGESVIADAVFFNGTRYPDVSNTILTVWIQNDEGKLEPFEQRTHYNLFPADTSGAELKFTDFNNDGFMDFYVVSYGENIYRWDELIWLNDGSGGFSNPRDNLFTINAEEDLPEWYDPTPFFFDANNDGVLDVITVRGVFDNDSYSFRNVGEEIRVFLGSDADPETVKNVYGESNEAQIIKTTDSTYQVITDIGTFNYTSNDRLKFTDTYLSLDLDSESGQAAKLIGAVFGREALEDKALVGLALHYLDEGMDYESLVEAAVRYEMGSEAEDNQLVVEHLYRNVFEVEPSDQEVQQFVEMLEGGKSVGWLGMMAAESSQNSENIDLIGLQQTGLAYQSFEN